MKAHDENSWMPGIIKSVATENIGIREIVDEIERHKEYLLKQKKFLKRREEHAKQRVKDIVEEKIHRELWMEKEDLTTKQTNNSLNSNLEKVINQWQNRSPYHIAEEIIDNYKNRK